MAISKNLLLKGLSGKLGRELVIRQYGDRTIVSMYPNMSKRKLTSKQKRMNEIMMEANYTAKAILADEEKRKEAQLRLNVTSNKLYTALIREYFKKALADKETSH